MSPPALAAHPRAGTVEPRRLAVRLLHPTEPTPHGELLVEAAFGSGTPRLGPLELSVAIDAEGDRATVSLAVRNATEQTVGLAGAIAGFVWKGHGLASLRYLRNGWQSWSLTGAQTLGDAGEPAFPSGPWLRGMHHAVGERPGDRAGWWESHLVTALGGAPTGPTCLAGLYEDGRSFGVVYLRRAGPEVQLELEWVVDAELAPGERRELEPARIALGDDASALLEAYADAYAHRANARRAYPFVAGWCSWYHFFHDVTEDDVLRNLDALAAARDELPVEVVQIDDGYQRAIGDWLETNHKFPRGLAPLAADIRAAGYTAGLWTAPFCVVAESRLFEKRREWLLQREGQPFRGLLHREWSANGAVHVLDTSRADVVDHLTELFRALDALGFGYLKLDFLYTAAMHADASDPRMGRAERLRRGLEAVRAGAGEEAFLLGCGCPLGPAVGIVDGMRIGPDVAPHWNADAAHAIPGIEPTQPSTRSAVRSILARVWSHRRLWLNDPDCLMARSGHTRLTRAERETLACATAASGGMVVFSDDIPGLAADDRELIRDTIAIAQQVDHLGVPGLARVPDLLAGEIAGAIAVCGPEATTVALLNTEDAARTCRFAEPDRRANGRSPGVEALIGPRPGTDGNGAVQVELGTHASCLFRVPRRFSLAVFCDYDGTFAVQDVGSTLAIRHAGERRREVWSRFEHGEVRAWDYNLEILGGMALPRPAVDAFLRTVEIDPGARDLVRWCGDHDVPFRVLSDGFDYNLNQLQVIHDVRFAYDANHLRFDRGVWRIAAGAPNPGCACGTGTCKRARIDALRARAPGATIVHIGNGRVSDTCGALAADVRFAKDSLATHLDELGVAYEPFVTLRDVIPVIEAL